MRSEFQVYLAMHQDASAAKTVWPQKQAAQNYLQEVGPTANHMLEQARAYDHWHEPTSVALQDVSAQLKKVKHEAHVFATVVGIYLASRYMLVATQLDRPWLFWRWWAFQKLLGIERCEVAALTQHVLHQLGWIEEFPAETASTSLSSWPPWGM